jgi:hypothetical protein
MAQSIAVERLSPVAGFRKTDLSVLVRFQAATAGQLPSSRYNLYFLQARFANALQKTPTRGTIPDELRRFFSVPRHEGTRRAPLLPAATYCCF